MKTNSSRATSIWGALIAIGVLVAPVDGIAGSWSRRGANAQNTGNAGQVSALTPQTVRHLRVVKHFAMDPVTSTAVVSGDLLVAMGWQGVIRVIDVKTGVFLIELDTDIPGHTAPTTPRFPSQLNVENIVQRWGGGDPLQATTPIIGTVTVPDALGGTREDERVYVTSMAAKELWCLDLDRIRADRAVLNRDPGDGYVCEGAEWPVKVNPNQSTGVFSRDQKVLVGGGKQTRDVIFQPNSGQEGSPPVEVWAIDAYTGEKLWIWDSPGQHGGIWASLSMSRDQSRIYFTTGNFDGGPTQDPMNGRGEAVVALDAVTGKEAWFHQLRVADSADTDNGNSATVADVEGPGGCHVVVLPDKDGCLYALSQSTDLQEVGDPDFDPFRIGQQRLRWRQCFTVGNIAGGFDATIAAFDGKTVFVTASQSGGTVGADDVNSFAVDACTGTLRWASSSIGWGFGEGALASSMFFQPDNTTLQVVSAGGAPAPTVPQGGVPTLLATVNLPGEWVGGGGPAIADGRIFVPMMNGVAMIEVVPGSNASPPVARGNDIFAGPYPAPVSPTAPASSPGSTAGLLPTWLTAALGPVEGAISYCSGLVMGQKAP
jgi:hypothetical protein